jgi:hypothetical protein
LSSSSERIDKKKEFVANFGKENLYKAVTRKIKRREGDDGWMDGWMDRESDPEVERCLQLAQDDIKIVGQSVMYDLSKAIPVTGRGGL